MGALNAKSTLWGADKNNDNGDILENLMMDSDCIIVNNKQPTHINFNGKTSSVLDYCIITVNLFDAFQEYVVLYEEDMTSDHLPYLVNFKMFNKNTIKNLNFMKKANADKPKSYNYKKADWKMFKSLLPKCIIPNNENNENNVEFIDDFVCNSLIKAADQAIPIFSNFYNDRKQLPEYILVMIKARKKARKLVQRDPNCKNAKKLYNKLTHEIRNENRAMKDKEWSEFTQKPKFKNSKKKFDNAFKIKVEKVVSEYKLMKNHNKN